VTIRSAADFVRLRESSKPEDYRRAANDEAPIEVWDEIVRAHPDMRFWVAQNKSVPLEILRILARDEDERVRSMVASKRKLDEATLSELARDSDDGVRHSVARNPTTPRAVLEYLRDDPWETVRHIAEKRVT